MPPQPLINLEKQKHHQNKPRFNDVYSRNNIPKIKDEAYVVNLDEKGCKSDASKYSFIG